MSRQTITRLAPAKLNLFLHITGRREDGYHELQTLFQLLDYGDELSFEHREAGQLALEAEGPTAAGMPLDGNLILRAADLLRNACGKPQLGAHIKILKRLPAGAGLGGGSSDAATTLVALNELWGLGLDELRLCQLGVTLGADVPVFVRGHSAWAEGIGEELTPVSLGEPLYLVVTPNCFVSTQRVFTQADLTRNTRAIKMRDFLEGRTGNDCEAVTRKLYPPVDAALRWLDHYAPARMTGTGASVFASFADEGQARSALADLPEGCTGFVARGMDRLMPRAYTRVNAKE